MQQQLGELQPLDGALSIPNREEDVARELLHLVAAVTESAENLADVVVPSQPFPNLREPRVSKAPYQRECRDTAGLGVVERDV